MKIFKLCAIAFMMIIITQYGRAQSMTVESQNGSLSTLDLSSIRSIVFENNNLVFNTADCSENYFNVFTTKQMFFNETTAIDNVDFQLASILIYPNPATNSITIDKGADGFSKASIYNLIGNKVMSFKLDNSQNTIDISSLPTGLYFLSTNNQSIKFIKQ